MEPILYFKILPNVFLSSKYFCRQTFVLIITDNIYLKNSKVFINDYFGGFSVSSQANIIQKGWGSATWFDVDADGNLDLLLNGDGGADGEGSSGSPALGILGLTLLLIGIGLGIYTSQMGRKKG